MNTKDLVRSNRIISKKRVKATLLFMALPLYLYHSLASKDYWTILFISCLALYAPALWAACALFLCYKTQTQFKQIHIAQIESAQHAIVQSIELNQLQKLSDAIETNPEILYFEYQRRTLIAWCKYYKNTRAQELVMDLMNKYPKGSKELMAA